MSGCPDPTQEAHGLGADVYLVQSTIEGMWQKRPLTIRLILEWADRHHDRTGRWPISRSGPVVHADDGTTWEGVNTALLKGARGLPGGDSLARLLRRRRKIADARMIWPDLTRAKILEWVDDHYDRTGTWPGRESGRVLCARGIAWDTVDRHLRKGTRSLPGGVSLADLLWTARHVKDGRIPFTEKMIVRWAGQHYQETGRWPVTLSGRVPGRDEDWAAIDMALRHARRGLTRKTSLSRLLTEHFADRYNPALRRLDVAQILKWADRYHRHTGRWPTHRSGPVPGAPHVKWSTIEYALKHGKRGLSRGTTLARLLDAHRRGRAHTRQKKN